ncbi:MAG: hypothetical protein ABEJ59_03205 [Halanaeroarchaeum sp.]
MDEYEATFTIESNSEARAVDRTLVRLYDTLREESRTIGTDAGDAAAMLEQFESLREAAGRHRPGTFTVVLEQRDEPFED